MTGTGTDRTMGERMRTRTMRTLACAGLFASAMAIAGVAHAEDTSEPAPRAAQVQRLSDQGATAYQQRDYRRANELFQQAYAIDPDPNLLYNIARCFEALGDKQTAIEKYELFISSPGADSKGRLRAQDAVRLLRSSSSLPPTSGVVAQPAGANRTAVTSSRAPAEGTHGSYVPAIVAFAIGAAGLVTGAVAGGLALSKRSSLDAVCTSAHACPLGEAGDISSLKTTSTLSTVGFVVGGVGAATGVALLLFRPSSRAEGDSAASLTPYVGPTGAGIAGTF